MSVPKTFYRTIAEIVLKETRYLKSYKGKILDVADDEKKGKILIAIPSLDIITKDEAPWVFPITANSIITPKVDDWVVVIFLEGDKNQPRYIGTDTLVKGVIPKIFDGNPKKHVLFESNDENGTITYDEDSKKFNFFDGKFTIEKAT